MTKLNPEICFRIREARRQAKLSQSTVALEVGCKQSALSMFEQGDGTKLNDEVIEKLAKKFNVSLIECDDSKINEKAKFVPVQNPIHGFCPNPSCPSNRQYEIEGRIFLKPEREVADPVGGRFCALCGEVLEKCCPNCGAPIHDGAICSYCGDPYISVL